MYCTFPIGAIPGQKNRWMPTTRNRYIKMLESNNYEYIKSIGFSCGIVWEMQRRDQTTSVAMKLLTHDDVSPGEIAIWQKLNQNNILKLSNLYFNIDLSAFVFEMPIQELGIDTSILVESFRTGSDALKKIKSWSTDILKGLQYLHHDQQLGHLQLKTSNILISKNGTAVIADFQYLCSIETPTTDYGIPSYLYPPEADKIFGRQVSVEGAPVDMWCYGLVVVNLVTSHILFKELTRFPISWRKTTYPELFKVLKKRRINKSFKLAYPNVYVSSKELKCMRNFVRMCLRLNPDKRATAESALQHQFLGGEGWAGKDKCWSRKVKPSQIEKVVNDYQRRLQIRYAPKQKYQPIEIPVKYITNEKIQNVTMTVDCNQWPIITKIKEIGYASAHSSESKESEAFDTIEVKDVASILERSDDERSSANEPNDISEFDEVENDSIDKSTSTKNYESSGMHPVLLDEYGKSAHIKNDLFQENIQSNDIVNKQTRSISVPFGEDIIKYTVIKKSKIKDTSEIYSFGLVKEEDKEDKHLNLDLDDRDSLDLNDKDSADLQHRDSADFVDKHSVYFDGIDRLDLNDKDRADLDGKGTVASVNKDVDLGEENSADFVVKHSVYFDGIDRLDLNDKDRADLDDKSTAALVDKDITDLGEKNSADFVAKHSEYFDGIDRLDLNDKNRVDLDDKSTAALVVEDVVDLGEKDSANLDDKDPGNLIDNTGEYLPEMESQIRTGPKSTMSVQIPSECKLRITEPQNVIKSEEETYSSCSEDDGKSTDLKSTLIVRPTSADNGTSTDLTNRFDFRVPPLEIKEKIVSLNIDLECRDVEIDQQEGTDELIDTPKEKQKEKRGSCAWIQKKVQCVQIFFREQCCCKKERRAP